MKGIMRRVTRALSKLTMFLWLLLLVWLIGIILIFVAFGDSGLWLLSLGLTFVSGVVVAAVYKSHVAATEVRLMRRELRAAFPLRKEVRNGRSTQRSLVALVEPTRGSSSGKNAKIKSDEVENNLSRVGHRKPRVAVIGTSSLKEHLSSVSEVTSLHPGISEALFEVEKPSAFVIEEASLLRGSWKSALSTSGQSMLKEVFRLCDMAIRHSLDIYVVPSTRRDASIQLVRDKATIVLDDAYISRDTDIRREASNDVRLFDFVSSLFDYAICKDRLQQ